MDTISQAANGQNANDSTSSCKRIINQTARCRRSALRRGLWCYEHWEGEDKAPPIPRYSERSALLCIDTTAEGHSCRGFAMKGKVRCRSHIDEEDKYSVDQASLGDARYSPEGRLLCDALTGSQPTQKNRCKNTASEGQVLCSVHFKKATSRTLQVLASSSKDEEKLEDTQDEDYDEEEGQVMGHSMTNPQDEPAEYAEILQDIEGGQASTADGIEESWIASRRDRRKAAEMPQPEEKSKDCSRMVENGPSVRQTGLDEPRQGVSHSGDLSRSEEQSGTITPSSLFQPYRYAPDEAQEDSSQLSSRDNTSYSPTPLQVLRSRKRQKIDGAAITQLEGQRLRPQSISHPNSHQLRSATNNQHLLGGTPVTPDIGALGRTQTPEEHSQRPVSSLPTENSAPLASQAGPVQYTDSPYLDTNELREAKMEDELEKYKSEVKRLPYEGYEDLGIYQRDLHEKDRTIAGLQEVISEHIKTIAGLREEIHLKDNRTKAFQAEINEKATKIQTLVAEYERKCSDKDAKIESANLDYQLSVWERTKVDKQLNDARAAKVAADLMAAAAHRECTRAKIEAKATKEENDTLMQEIKQRDNEKVEVLKEQARWELHDELEHEKKQHKGEISDLQEKVLKKKQEYSKLVNELQIHTGEKSDLERTIVAQQEELDAIKKENASLKASVSRLQEETDRLNQEVQKKPHRSLEEELRAAREEIPKALDEMKINLDQLREIRRDLDL